MTAIWGMDGSGGWRPLSASDYRAEQALHDLVVDGPQMLPLSGSPQLTVLGTEVQLGSGRADIVAVESSGRLVVIEVKLAASPEARRAVVAQVLAYAAYLQGLDVAYLQSVTLGRHLRQLGVASIFGAVSRDDQGQAVDAETFDEALAESLAAGSFRIVIVLDSVPDELVQLVGYLESLTSIVVIDLVTVTAYEVGESRVLVPQRIDPARRVAELSAAEAASRQANALQAGSGEFRVAAESAPPEHRDLLRRLIEWAECLDRDGLVALSTYRGKNDITTLLPRLRADQGGLATVYLGPSGVYVQLWPTVFTRRAPEAVSVVERALDGPIKYGQRITTVSEELLAALTSAYREAAGSATA